MLHTDTSAVLHLQQEGQESGFLCLICRKKLNQPLGNDVHELGHDRFYCTH